LFNPNVFDLVNTGFAGFKVVCGARGLGWFSLPFGKESTNGVTIVNSEEDILLDGRIALNMVRERAVKWKAR